MEGFPKELAVIFQKTKDEWSLGDWRMFAEYLESAYKDAMEQWGSALELAEFFAKERERLIFSPMLPLKRKG